MHLILLNLNYFAGKTGGKKIVYRCAKLGNDDPITKKTLTITLKNGCKVTKYKIYSRDVNNFAKSLC